MWSNDFGEGVQQTPPEPSLQPSDTLNLYPAFSGQSTEPTVAAAAMAAQNQGGAAWKLQLLMGEVDALAQRLSAVALGNAAEHLATLAAAKRLGESGELSSSPNFPATDFGASTTSPGSGVSLGAAGGMSRKSSLCPTVSRASGRGERLAELDGQSK